MRYGSPSYWRSGAPEAHASRLAIAQRSAAAVGPAGGRRPPVIVKLVSSTHSRAASRAVVDYIARLDGRATGDQGVTVHDGLGREIPRHRVREEFAGWNLASDAENLSREARERRKAGHSPADLAPQRRFRNVQCRHFVLSAPVGKELEPLFEAAVGGVVRSTFAAWGHQVMWGVHDEHGKALHAHVFVRAQRDDGTRLRVDRDGALFDALREMLARQCRDVGLDVEATRRVDRGEFRGEAAEDPALKRPVRRAPWQGEAGQLPSLGRIEAVAPDWVRQHGFAMMSRMMARARRRALGEPPDPMPHRMPAAPADPGDPYAKLRARLRAIGAFTDEAGRDRTDDAVLAFDRLRREEWSGRRRRVTARARPAPLSDWLLTRQPVTFGPVSRAARNLLFDPEVKRLLRLLPEPGPPLPSRPAPPPSQADVAQLQSQRERARLAGMLRLLARGLELAFPGQPVALERAIRLRDIGADLLQGRVSRQPRRPSQEPPGQEIPGPSGREKAHGLTLD